MKTSPITKHKWFLNYLKRERAAFSRHFYNHPTADRVAAENLLIAYDQMVELISKK